MAEHLVPDGTVTYLVIKSAVHGLGAYYLHLAVVQTCQQFLDSVIYARLKERQLRIPMFLDILSASGLQPDKFPFLASRAQTAHDTVASTGLVYYLDVGATRLVDLATYEHTAKLARDTQNGKFFRK